MKFLTIREAMKRGSGEITIRGWVYRERGSSQFKFIVLRDATDIIQTVIKKEKIGDKKFQLADKIQVEASMEITGTIRKDHRAPTGYEIEVNDFKVIGESDKYPITEKQSKEFLMDMRHLWIRSRKATQVLKIRSEVFKAIHDFYRSRGFIEFQSPIFTTNACEGGSTLFEVPYFGKKGVYLSQSWQLYAEAGIFGLEKIYTVTPAFRAEKSRTSRHLSEYWTAEMEASWMDYEELLRHQEDLILHIVSHILKTCKKELRELGRDTKELEKLKKPFLRIRYKDAIKKLGLKQGHDLTDKEERKLVEMLGSKPIFLTHFPRDMKAFYMKVDPKDPKTVLAADLLISKVGEVTGGSERISDQKELLESLKLFKLSKSDYEWYLDLRKYGTVPHSGFGLGIGRLVMWIAGTEHIMDTIPFPRTMVRYKP